MIYIITAIVLMVIGAIISFLTMEMPGKRGDFLFMLGIGLTIGGIVMLITNAITFKKEIKPIFETAEAIEYHIDTICTTTNNVVSDTTYVIKWIKK